MFSKRSASQESRPAGLGLRKILMAGAVALVCAPAAWAEPVTQSITVQQTDWTSAGVGGIGTTGAGDITLAGVTGTVTGAYLYWHGIDQSGGIYDNPTASFDGNPVTGDLLGGAPTNCWGDGESRAYRADVTAFVSGDGTYSLADLAAGGAQYNVNGASLIVTYDDANAANNRDIVIFDGNDSSNADPSFPADPDGWDATLSGINYGGGTVGLQLHVGDGQDFSDDSVSFTTVNGAFNLPDDSTLYDGFSVPDEGNGRDGALWDIHDIDITSAFGGVPANVDLTLSGMDSSGDCLALIAVVVDLEPGSAPPPPPPPPPPGPAFSVPVDSPWALLMLALMMLGVVGFYRLPR